MNDSGDVDVAVEQAMGRFSWGETTQADTKRFLEPICHGLSEVAQYWSTIEEQGQFSYCSNVVTNGPEGVVVLFYADPESFYNAEWAFYWGPTTRDDLTYFFLDVCYT
ncbi:MAG: hypothetical protein K8R99_01515 [Actinomycetia bacterium]|nr:hypothetical protein [Actinomycetes bacterium]